MVHPMGEKKYIAEMFESIKKYWEENEKKVYHLDSLIPDFSGVDLNPILQVVFQVVFLKTIENKTNKENMTILKTKNLLVETAIQLERDFTSYLTALTNNELKHLDSLPCSS